MCVAVCVCLYVCMCVAVCVFVCVYVCGDVCEFMYINNWYKDKSKTKSLSMKKNLSAEMEKKDCMYGV